MWCVLHLGLVQHGEGTDSPPVVQAVQLLLLLLPSPLWSLVLVLTPGIADETLSPPLDLIQEREVALSTVHPCEGTVLHDGPHLRLVQLHEAVGVE